MAGQSLGLVYGAGASIFRASPSPIPKNQGMLGWVGDPASAFPDRTNEGEELGSGRSWERLCLGFRNSSHLDIPSLLQPRSGVRNNPRVGLSEAPGLGGIPTFSCAPGEFGAGISASIGRAEQGERSERPGCCSSQSFHPGILSGKAGIHSLSSSSSFSLFSFSSVSNLNLALGGGEGEAPAMLGVTPRIFPV